MTNIFEYQDLQPRWASPENPTGAVGGAHRNDDGRKRRAKVPLPAGERLVLAEVSGQSGTVRRIWMTITDRTPDALRGLRLRMTWDGAATAAVDAPLGDFFCHGAGRMARFENEFFSSPEGRSFVCIVPMPFRCGMRIELINESAVRQDKVFYDVDYTLGDQHGPESLYLHAHWRRERPTTLGRDFTVLPQVTGRGRLLGVLMSVITDTNQYGQTWWGEGEMKIYLDGDTTHPTLCGTGTEDWIGTAWGQGQFAQRYQGCSLASDNVFAFYRFHVPDPIFFRLGIRAHMQQIGVAGVKEFPDFQRRGLRLFHGDQELDLADHLARGKASLFERKDDVAACTWFYLDRPENGLPELVQVAERLAGVSLPTWSSAVTTAHPDERFRLLDLRPVANRVLRGGRADQGWLDLDGVCWPQMPSGALTVTDIPFDIVGDDAHDRPRSLLALGGLEHLKHLPRESAPLALPPGLRRIWILHTAGWQQSPVGTTVWSYDLRLADGEVRSVPVRAGIEVGDWIGAPQHGPALSVYDHGPKNLVNLWVQPIELPTDQQAIELIVRSAGRHEVALILAITGEAD
jgi:hypothetical protein